MIKNNAGSVTTVRKTVVKTECKNGKMCAMILTISKFPSKTPFLFINP